MAQVAGTKARRRVLHLGLAVLFCLSPWLPADAQAQGIEQARVQLSRPEGGVALTVDIRLSLPKAVESALLHGVPVYFAAQATLYRQRWYWRDERVARVSRLWRVSYQPLTSSWRASLGGLSQSYPSLADALNAISRSTEWKVAEPSVVDAEARHYVEFTFRLDTSQLPGPMQIGLAGQGDWQLSVERTLRVDPAP